MKIGAFALLWMAVYFAPQLITDAAYEPYFNLYQSLAPFTLLLATTVLMPSGWARRSMMSVIILQVALNAFDAVLSLTDQTYNQTQGVLNSIEAMLLFLWGTEVWGDFFERRWHGSNPPDRHNSDQQRVRHRG